jgi:hypothetical protein
MGGQIELRCRCGEARGLVTDLSPRTVNRIVCYCEDCQAFAHQLGRADLLNAKGGSDIIQVAPATVSFTQGAHRIVGLRLTPKGLYRWHASCCNTPIGSTMGPALPFVGIVAQAFAATRLDDVVGSADCDDLRQICRWRSATRFDSNQAVVAAARHRQGAGLAA